MTRPESRGYVGRVIRGITGVTRDRLVRWSSPWVGPNPQMVLIFGMPKAGTSAVTHLLADACAMTKTVDIPPLWETPVAEVLAGTVPASLLIRRHAGYFHKDLVKEPGLTPIMPQLAEALPDAQLVFVVRDPRTNLRSLLQRRNVPGDVEQLEDSLRRQIYTGWHPAYFFPKRYRPQESYYSQGRHYIEGLARQWQANVEACTRTQEAGSRQVHVIRYEDFVQDKHATIETLARDLGREVVCDIASRVDAQYQPKGDHSMGTEEFFGPANLRRIARECREGMQRYAYPSEPCSSDDDLQ